eukprot:6933646-Alexandrium_andersonii.AAC.1
MCVKLHNASKCLACACAQEWPAALRKIAMLRHVMHSHMYTGHVATYLRMRTCAQPSIAVGTGRMEDTDASTSGRRHWPHCTQSEMEM